MQKGWGTGGEIEPGKLRQGISGSSGNQGTGSPRAPDPLPIHETTPRHPRGTCHLPCSRDTRAACVPVPAQAGATQGPRRRLRQRWEGVGGGRPAAVEAAPVSGRHAPSHSSVHKPASRSNSPAANRPLLPLPIGKAGGLPTTESRPRQPRAPRQGRRHLTSEGAPPLRFLLPVPREGAVGRSVLRVGKGVRDGQQRPNALPNGEAKQRFHPSF